MVNTKTASIDPRARLQVDERRAQLIGLGRKLFAHRTYDELSIDAIAAEAGISKGLLYHYFPSKRHLYIETVRSAAAEMLALTFADATLPPDAQLFAGLDAYLDYVERNAAAYSALLRSGVGFDPEVLAIVESTRRTMIDRLLLGLGIAKPAALLRVALRGWIGFVESASLAWIDGRGVRRAAMRDLLAASLMATLAASTDQKIDLTSRAPSKKPRRTR